MKGKDLFQQYTSKRDYSGSKADEYAQLLFTIFFHIQDAIYPLLEKAETAGKKLSIKESYHDDVTIDQYSAADVILL
jgi:hypothetical protein